MMTCALRFIKGRKDSLKGNSKNGTLVTSRIVPCSINSLEEMKEQARGISHDGLFVITILLFTAVNIPKHGEVCLQSFLKKKKKR